MVKRTRKGKKYHKELRSGISEKSRSANIEKKHKWPSAMLDGIFDEKEICFKDLTLSQFVCGELAIWQHPKTSKVEQKAREILLQRVVRNEPKLRFSKAKEIYKQFVSKVEKGNISWKNLSEIDRIETEVILLCVNVVEKLAGSKKTDAKKKTDIILCKEYNKGSCNLPDVHDQLFQGKTVKAHHICRKYYSKNKERKKHKELMLTVCLTNGPIKITWMMS